jgi:ketosteroid isomerase-like protein
MSPVAHPNVERIKAVMTSGSDGLPDAEAMRGLLAEDVVWREAGNPVPIRGREAVIARMSAAPPGATMKVDAKAVVGDDDAVIWEGYATFDIQGRHLEYPFVERYTMRDGKIVERQSYMDAVPAHAAEFFAAFEG